MDGTITHNSDEDPLIGLKMNSLNETPTAKLVDLDVDSQMVSAHYGL